MASVFAAEDTLLARKVAVKVLRGSSGATVAADRFLHEARALASLDAPHLVPLYDAGWHDGAPFLVMKLLSGRTLRDLLREGRGLPESRALAIVSQVLKALGHIHRRGLVHRDVKPENVFVAHDDHVTLVDLGIAFDARHDPPAPGQSVVGTPRYMSPEQAKGEHGDARSDLYAVGLLLFEAMTGRSPFAGVAEGTTGEGVVTRPSLSPEALVAIPYDITDVVMRALDPDPARRFQSAMEMRGALLKIPRSGARRRTPLEFASVTVPSPDVDTEVGKIRS
jgi:serine/threonine-protein kinase